MAKLNKEELIPTQVKVTGVNVQEAVQAKEPAAPTVAAPAVATPKVEPSASAVNTKKQKAGSPTNEEINKEVSKVNQENLESAPSDVEYLKQLNEKTKVADQAEVNQQAVLEKPTTETAIAEPVAQAQVAGQVAQAQAAEQVAQVQPVVSQAEISKKDLRNIEKEGDASSQEQLTDVNKFALKNARDYLLKKEEVPQEQVDKANKMLSAVDGKAESDNLAADIEAAKGKRFGKDGEAITYDDKKVEEELAAKTTSSRSDITKMLQDSYGDKLLKRNGIWYGMDNGSIVPIVDENGVVTLKNGLKKRIDSNGNVVDYVKEEEVSRENETPHERRMRERDDDAKEVENTVFDWMDVHGVTSLSPDNLRTLMDEGVLGSKLSAYASKKGIKFDGLSREKTLRALTEDYKSRQEKFKDKSSSFGDLKFIEQKKPATVVNADGSNKEMPPEAVNEIIQIAKKYNVLLNKKPAMLMNDPNTKNFQQDMADYAARYGIDLQKLQGRDLLVDAGHLGQNTVGSLITLLTQVASEPQLNYLGLQSTPDGVKEFIPDDTWLKDLFDKKALDQESEFELKRNKRLKNWESLSQTVSSIGDVISGSQGVEVKDKTQEFKAASDKLETTYFGIKKDYQDRMTALDKEQKDAKSKREQLQIEMYKNYIQMQHNKDMAYLNNKLDLGKLKYQQDFTGKQNDLNRAVQRDGQRLQYESDMARAEAAKANARSAAGAKTDVGILLRNGSIKINKGSEGAYFSAVGAAMNNETSLRKVINPANDAQEKAMSEFRMAIVDRNGTAKSADDVRIAINRLLPSLTEAQQDKVKSTYLEPIASRTFDTESSQSTGYNYATMDELERGLLGSGE